MSNNELIQACKELAQESFEYMRIKMEARKEGEYLTDDYLLPLTNKGAWDKYKHAGGSLTMINRQLSREDDFGGQYNKLCIDSNHPEWI